MAEAETALHRAGLIQEAFRLEYLTLAWMVIEAGVAIGAGVAAHSVTLVAFGIDSLIELASAIVLVWRLTVELRHGQSFAELSSGAPAALAARCCSRSPPMSSPLPDGACGRVGGRSSRGRA